MATSSARLAGLLTPLGLVGLALGAACAGAKTDRSMPAGQLLDQTTVGQNRCSETNPTDKPFVVEWDATDAATFEALAQRDVVVVRYENCELEVLDGCMDDGIPGAYGAYQPPRWTSGSVEGFEIDNTLDLYAKLPLGAAKFSANVEAGNRLSLQYFVSGTVTTTRPAVYAEQVAQNPRCEGATHFVRAYNLGAFVLNTEARDSESATVDVKGTAGGGGSRSHEAKRLKQGGELDSCTADTAADLSRCKVPIRITLRELETGAAPTAGGGPVEAAPPADPGTGEPWQQAAKLISSAGAKMQSGDGAGCLLDLDRAKEIHAETEAKVGNVRGTCEMLAGRCEDGKKRLRLYYEQNVASMTSEQIDMTVSSTAKQFCGNSKLTPKERIAKADSAIGQASIKRDAATCLREAGEVAKLLETLDKKTQSRERTDAGSVLMKAAQCAGKAGKCEEARKLVKTYVRATEGKKGLDARTDEVFRQRVRDCE